MSWIPETLKIWKNIDEKYSDRLVPVKICSNTKNLKRKIIDEMSCEEYRKLIIRAMKGSINEKNNRKHYGFLIGMSKRYQGILETDNDCCIISINQFSYLQSLADNVISDDDD